MGKTKQSLGDTALIMAYKVSATFNYLTTRIAKTEGVDITRVSFDTESVLLSEVALDAACEVLTHRMHNGRDYCANPSHTVITAYPTLTIGAKK